MADFTFDGGHAAPHPSNAVAAGSGGSIVHWAGAAASLALIAAVGVWGYGVLARDVSGVPVVQAMQGPMRIQPPDPGGTLMDHQGLSVNAVAGQGAAEGPAHQLILAPSPAGLAAEDVATGALIPVSPPTPAPLQASLAEQAQIVELLPEATPVPEDNPILALAAQIAADSEPLSPLTPGSEAPVLTEVQDVSSAASDAAPETDADNALELTDLPKPGPGLARSLRPVLRPSGLRTASLSVAASDAVPAQTVLDIDPASLEAGTRLVQIGAFDSPETARAEWQRLEARFGEYLEGKGRVVQRATSGGRVFYRLRAQGFEDLSDARRFCAAFVAQNVDCIPVVTR